MYLYIYVRITPAHGDIQRHKLQSCRVHLRRAAEGLRSGSAPATGRQLGCRGRREQQRAAVAPSAPAPRSRTWRHACTTQKTSRSVTAARSPMDGHCRPRCGRTSFVDPEALLGREKCPLTVQSTTGPLSTCNNRPRKKCKDLALGITIIIHTTRLESGVWMWPFKWARR